jgi:glutaredoxin-related protein
MKVTLYTKHDCFYCSQAKVLLASKNIQFTELKLNEDFSRANLLEMFPSAKTFPVVVVDGFNIGGFSQLQTIISEQTSSTAKLLNE